MAAEAGLISVVLPVCNEREALAGTVGAVAAALAGCGARHEIILVDDGSADGSWEVIAGLSRATPGVRGLRLTRNFGQQAALLAGLAAARGAAVVTLDADGQHPPEALPEFLAAWRRGAEVVQGLRTGPGASGPVKRWGSRVFYRVFSWLAGTRVPEGACDFRLLSRRAADLALEHPRAALFLRGFLPWTGLRTEHVAFRPAPRAAGGSKYSLLGMLRLARLGLLRFSLAPLRLSILLGLLTSALSLGYLVYVLAVRIFTTHAVTGWALVAGLLALLGGVQLLVIGILGEYVGMVFQMQLGRPEYVVAEVVGDTGLEPVTPSLSS